MPIFSSPKIFEEHKQYIVLLKKALLTVKPEVRKKFLYFKQYPFGAKKLPLVLVDFDANCSSALSKAGHKPTDEGMVSLTPQEELNFEAKKGNLKRARIKKYLATMGGGIKPVYVPPGETDDEAELDNAASTGTPPVTPPSPDTNDAELKRQQLLARIQDLQGKPFPVQVEALKKQVLEKAKALGDAKKFAEATLLLDQFAAKASPASPGKSAASGPFPRQWAAARQSWQQASDTLDSQIAQLQQVLRKSNDVDLKEIAEFGLNGVTGNFKVPLMAAMREVDGASGDALKKASANARAIIAGFRKHIESDEKVEVCDENPFGVPVSIRQTLGEALTHMDVALASA